LAGDVSQKTPEKLERGGKKKKKQDPAAGLDYDQGKGGGYETPKSLNIKQKILRTARERAHKDKITGERERINSTKKDVGKKRVRKRAREGKRTLPERPTFRGKKGFKKSGKEKKKTKKVFVARKKTAGGGGKKSASEKGKEQEKTSAGREVPARGKQEIWGPKRQKKNPREKNKNERML